MDPQHKGYIALSYRTGFPNSCWSIIALPKCWLRVSLAEFDPILVYLLLVAKPPAAGTGTVLEELDGASSHILIRVKGLA